MRIVVGLLLAALIALGTALTPVGAQVVTGGPNVTSLPITPQGRLTLQSVTPVMTTTQASKTSIIYTPYVGAMVPFYDGTNFYVKLCAELTNDTTASSSGNAGPAAVTTNSNYDLVVWDNGGACTLTRMAVWTSDTARASTLTRTNGIWLNTASVTNGPAALRGTYVGTVRSDGSSQINYTFGAQASGGTAAVFGVWNQYNRVAVTTIVSDSTGTWTYTSSTTHAVNASNGNRISFVTGQAEDGIDIRYSIRAAPTGIAGTSFASAGMALDATNTIDRAATVVAVAGSVAESTSTMTAQNAYAPQIGFHYIQATEQGDNTNATTFNGGTSNGGQMALVGILRM